MLCVVLWVYACNNAVVPALGSVGPRIFSMFQNAVAMLCVKIKIDFSSESFRNLIPSFSAADSPCSSKVWSLRCGPQPENATILLWTPGATRILKEPHDSRPVFAYGSNIEARIKSMLGMNMIRSQGFPETKRRLPPSTHSSSGLHPQVS